MKKTPKFNSNPITLIRCASYIETEGWISLEKTKSPYLFFPRIGVANTDKEMLKWLKKNFKGKIERVSVSKDSHNKKPLFRWIMSGLKPTKSLVKAIFPYLILKEKKKKARELLEYTSNRLKMKRGHQMPAFLTKDCS